MSNLSGSNDRLARGWLLLESLSADSIFELNGRSNKKPVAGGAPIGG